MMMMAMIMTNDNNDNELGNDYEDDCENDDEYHSVYMKLRTLYNLINFI